MLVIQWINKIEIEIKLTGTWLLFSFQPLYAILLRSHYFILLKFSSIYLILSKLATKILSIPATSAPVGACVQSAWISISSAPCINDTNYFTTINDVEVQSWSILNIWLRTLFLLYIVDFSLLLSTLRFIQNAKLLFRTNFISIFWFFTILLTY